MKRVYYARAVDSQDRSALLSEAAAVQSALAPYDLTVIDPVAIGGENFRPPQEVVHTDLDLLRRSDAVLMDLSIEGWTYVGCICELVYAHLWRIPSVVFVPPTELVERKWLLYHATRVVVGKEAAIEALLELIVPSRLSARHTD
jgi:hypothetical protein